MVKPNLNYFVWWIQLILKQSTADSINDNLNVTNAMFQVQNYEPYNYCMVHIIRQTDCPTDANAGSTALSMHENTVNYIWNVDIINSRITVN